jgi:hypothetical protein
MALLESAGWILKEKSLTVSTQVALFCENYVDISTDTLRELPKLWGSYSLMTKLFLMTSNVECKGVFTSMIEDAQLIGDREFNIIQYAELLMRHYGIEFDPDEYFWPRIFGGYHEELAPHDIALEWWYEEGQTKEPRPVPNEIPDLASKNLTELEFRALMRLDRGRSTALWKANIFGWNQRAVFPEIEWAYSMRREHDHPNESHYKQFARLKKTRQDWWSRWRGTPVKRTIYSALKYHHFALIPEMVVDSDKEFIRREVLIEEAIPYDFSKLEEFIELGKGVDPRSMFVDDGFGQWHPDTLAVDQLERLYPTKRFSLLGQYAAKYNCFVDHILGWPIASTRLQEGVKDKFYRVVKRKPKLTGAQFLAELNAARQRLLPFRIEEDDEKIVTTLEEMYNISELPEEEEKLEPAVGRDSVGESESVSYTAGPVPESGASNVDETKEESQHLQVADPDYEDVPSDQDELEVYGSDYDLGSDLEVDFD